MERNICIDAKSSDLCLNKRGLMPGLRGMGFFPGTWRGDLTRFATRVHS